MPLGARLVEEQAVVQLEGAAGRSGGRVASCVDERGVGLEQQHEHDQRLQLVGTQGGGGGKAGGEDMRWG